MTSATRLSRVTIATALAMLAAPAVAGPAYLKIGDIKGESTGKGHEGQIEILSWSWGEARKGNVEYGWKVEEGESAPPAPGEAEITLKGAAAAGTRPGKMKTGDVTLKRGVTGEGAASGGVNVAAGDVNDAAGSQSGLPTGKRQHKPFAVTKPVDKAAGSLTAVVPAGMCRIGARYPSAEMGTGDAVYRLQNLVVTSCSPATSADGGSRPTETIALNYEEIK